MGLTKMKIDKYNILEALMQSESRISLKDMREAINEYRKLLDRDIQDFSIGIENKKIKARMREIERELR